MIRGFTAALAGLLLLVGPYAALAADGSGENSRQSQKMDDATSILRQFVDIPENAIPSVLLRQAYGIAVIPSVYKIGFLLAVRHGNGVMAVRTDSGGWSNPVFISLTGGSIGFQAGANSTDIILVFKTRRSVERIADGDFTLGADASVAAGPVGRSAGAATNLTFSAEVYSYSRSRGLFAGVAIDGAHLGIDQDSNWLFYNKAGLAASTILARGKYDTIPLAGQRLVYTLDRYMPPSGDQFNYSADTRSGPPRTPGNGPDNGSGPGNDPHGSGQVTPYRPRAGTVSVQQNSGTGAGGGPPAAVGRSQPQEQNQGNQDYGSQNYGGRQDPNAGS